MISRRGGYWFVGLWCAATLGACRGVSSEVGSMDEGEQKCEAGATKPAGDGCNTCTCDEQGDWACTQVACNLCEEGATRPAEDGCNTCVCGADGDWACTNMTCNECQNGETRMAGDGCNTCTCRNGTWGCTMAACNPLVCTEGFADCDDDPVNGCETNLESTTESCGACDNYCVHAGGTSRCEEGRCVLAGCDAPYEDCNGDPDDGCEALVSNGSCSNRCESTAVGSGPVPAEGNCECPAGMACVRGSLEDPDPDSEFCYPIPEGCPNGFASCGCIAGCFCPADTGATCYDEMAAGGVFIMNCAGYP